MLTGLFYGDDYLIYILIMFLGRNWFNAEFLCYLYTFQRQQTKASTPLTTELFYEWKKKKMEQKEAEHAAKIAERAKNDRMR